MSETIKIGQHQYHTHAMLQVGDYGGAGSVGFGNIEFLKHLYPDQVETSLFKIENSKEATPQNDLVIMIGQFGSISAYLKAGNEEKIFKALEKYPALDDEYVSRVENEWIKDAVKGMRGYFENDLPEKLADKSEGLTEEQFLIAFLKACNAADYAPVMEHSSAFIDEAKVNEALTKVISEMKLKHAPDSPSI